VEACPINRVPPLVGLIVFVMIPPEKVCSPDHEFAAARTDAQKVRTHAVVVARVVLLSGTGVGIVIALGNVIG
jgi:hypothetical protein